MGLTHPLWSHIFLIILILAMVALSSTGIMDIDWQINSYHMNEINPNQYWYFTPTWKMFWWDAYVFTLMRIIVGFILLGFVIADLYHMGEYERGYDKGYEEGYADGNAGH